MTLTLVELIEVARVITKGKRDRIVHQNVFAPVIPNISNITT